MKTLRSALAVCRLSIMQYLEKSNVILGFAVGFIFSIAGTAGLKAYSQALQQNLSIFEPWIYLSSDSWNMMFIYLGGIFIIADAPFISGIQMNTIWRTSRVSWIMGQIVYVFATLLIYFTMLNLVVFIYYFDSINMSVAWSDAFSSLSNEYAAVAFDRFKIAYPFQIVMKSYSTVQGWILSLTLQISYCFLVDCVLFAGQLISRRNLGWIFAVVIHLIGYIYLQEPYSFLTAWALPVRSMFGFSFIIREMPPISNTLCQFWLTIVALQILLLLTARNTDLVSKEFE